MKRRSRRTRSDLLGIVETAYRIDDSDQAWRQDLADSAQAVLDRGLGVTVAEFYAHPGGGAVLAEPLVFSGASQPMQAAAMLAWESLKPEELPVVLDGIGTCATASEGLGAEALKRHPFWLEHYQPAGIHDILWIGMPDPASNGCAIGVALPEITRVSNGERRAFRMLGAHLAAAARLRRRLRVGAREPDAVLRADGVVDTVRGEAKTPRVRAALRSAVVAIDSARCDLRAGDEEAALSAWRSLVAAGWSLIDEFDRGGRHYLIAHANEPQLSECQGLSHREQLVAEYSALGHSNKFIAYELGLSASSVGTYLRRAMNKLNIDTRLQLIQHFKRQ